jgi:hypothetical protein
MKHEVASMPIPRAVTRQPRAHFLIRSFLFVLWCCCAARGAEAQTRATTADLAGVVRDPSGLVAPGAQVEVVQADGRVARVAVSQGDGRFDVAALAPGRYVVRVSLAGFATQVLEHVELPLGSRLDLDVGLTLATPNEQIVVRADVPALDVQRTAGSTVVGQAQLEALPINGRNFVSLSLITPAVTVDRVPQQGAAAGSGLTFVGQRARSNNITVDGLDNTDGSVGSVRVAFSQDAIQEFQVVAHSYTAEFGNATGGVVNIVTRSGGNATTGSAFGYFRDEALNAREYFERYAPDGSKLDVPKAPFHQHQVGGVLGGPLRKDRAFYFASFERLGSTANNFVTIDQSRPVAVFGQELGSVADLLQRAGFPVHTGHVPYDIDSSSLMVKLDHRLSDSRSLMFRYAFGDAHHGNVEPFGGIVAESRGGALDSRDHVVAAAHTSVHGNAVNELRLQLARRDQGVFPLDPTCNGPCDRDDEGGPTVEIAGVANAGRHRIYPQLRDYLRYQALDTFTRVAGRHELKVGFDLGVQQALKSTLPLTHGGRFIFTALPAVPGLLPAPVTATQAFALGLPGAYVQGYGNPTAKLHATDLSVFAQDAWRPRQDLTVKLGVRYQTQVWPDTRFDVPGIGPYTVPQDSNNVAPRLAVAWAPGGSASTTVHGAYGVFFDRQVNGVLTTARIVDGSSTGTRTLVLRFPLSIAAWQAPGRRMPEPATAYPSLVIALDPAMRTPYAHHTSFGVDRLLPGRLTLTANGVWVRGFGQLGTIDYNPVSPSLGAGRRPLDAGGVPGTSASVLQYTSFGESWYRALLLSLEKRFNQRHQLLASYTLSKTEDTSSDFQSASIVQDNGRGRDPADPTGLPLGFDPRADKGPALHDQRHRLVLSGTYVAPAAVSVSGILTAASGTPFNILAGVDLNGDGDGGSFPADRARGVLADPSTSVSRNAGRLPSQVTLDVRVSRVFEAKGMSQVELLVEAFNLLNRTNITEVNGVFGTGAYPSAPLSTYGQWLRSAPPLQVQLGARVRF